MTIAEFLIGSFDHKFSDANIQAVLVSRGILPETPQQDVSEKDKDLAKADLYEILANVVSGGGKKVQKGNRAVSERLVNFGVYDRRYYAQKARELRAKWGVKEGETKSVQFRKIFDIR